MNGKSQTKKILTVSKTKFQIDTAYKKHKSQESYSDLKTISTQNPLKSSKSKQNLSPKYNTKNSLNANNKITNVKIKNVMNMISINTSGNNNNNINYNGLNMNSNSPVANAAPNSRNFNTANCSSNGNNTNNFMNHCNNFASCSTNNNSSNANNSGSNIIGNAKSEKNFLIKNNENNLQNIFSSNFANNKDINNANNDSNSIYTNSKIDLTNLTHNNLHNLLLNSNSKSKLEKHSEKVFLKNSNSKNNFITNNTQLSNIKANIINYNTAAALNKNNIVYNKPTIFSQDCAKIIDTEENEEDFAFDSQTPEKYQNLSNIESNKIPKQKLNETFKGLNKINSKSNFKTNTDNDINNKNSNTDKGKNIIESNSKFNKNSDNQNKKTDKSNLNIVNLEAETPITKRNINSKSPRYNNAFLISKANSKYENSDQNTIIEEFDEMRSNCHLRDFYTNSIGEASCSLIDKGEGIINNIPNTFVRQSENKLIIQKNSKPYMEHIAYLSSNNTNKIDNDKSTSYLNALNQTSSLNHFNNYSNVNYNTKKGNYNNKNKHVNNNENDYSNTDNSGSNLELNGNRNNCFAKISSTDEVTDINDYSEILEKSYLINNKLSSNDSVNPNTNKSACGDLIGLNNQNSKDLDKKIIILEADNNNSEKILKTQQSKNYLSINQTQDANKNIVSSDKDNNSTYSNTTAKLSSDKKAKIAFSKFSNNNSNKKENHKNLNQIFNKISKVNNNINQKVFNNNTNKLLATSYSNNIFNTNFDFKKYMVDSKPRNSNVKANINYNSNNNLNLNNNSMNHLENYKNGVFYTNENNISPTNKVTNSKLSSNANVGSNTKTKLIIKKIEQNNQNINTNNNNNNDFSDCNNNYNITLNKTQSNIKNNNQNIYSKINKNNYTSNRDSNLNLLSSVEIKPAQKDIAYPAQFSSREMGVYESNSTKTQQNGTQQTIKNSITNNNNTNSINNANTSIITEKTSNVNNNSIFLTNNNTNNNNQAVSGEASHNLSSSSSTASSNINLASNVSETSLIQKLYSKLLICAKKGDRDTFLETLSHIYKIEGNKTNISFKDENGWTALHFAADEGNFKIIEILMKMNVDSNLRTLAKKTALHLSAEKGYFDVSRMLIENGALLSLLDDEKNSPIHLCALKGHFELLKYFLEKFPQADTKNIYGKTPLDLASNNKIRELLLEFLNKKSYNFHKITIHNANSKKVDEFLSNVKNSCNTDFSNNNNEPNKNLNFSNINKNNHYETSNISKFNTKSGSDNNIINITQNQNYQSEKFNNDTGNKNNKNNLDYRNFASNNYTNNHNLIEQKSSGSSSSMRNSSGNPINSSLDNMKLKRMRTTENNYSEEHSASSNLEHFSSYEEEKIGPSAFICHALLGKGSFGEVYLVEKCDTKIFYAMKVLSKDKIMAQNLVKYAMTERNVLSVTNHPFIVKLNYSFQSSDKLFLILDYCPGGDLAEHLSNEKRFSEERAKIYLCEIILALEDLHKRDIIFRDLKPDNVVLDYEGHAMLTDFGLSKEGVYDNKGAKSFCGSIAYLAPEMLKRSGHGKSVDWYLLGVLFYEMLVGLPPFFNSNKDQLFKNIETQELQYPKYISESAGNLIRDLLHKDPYTRLGAGKNDAEDIKNHPYLKDVNWDDVYKRKLKPPVPILKNKYIELLNTPKIFEENENLDDCSEENSNKYFDNWSFVKNNHINTNNN